MLTIYQLMKDFATIHCIMEMLMNQNGDVIHVIFHV
jgi:hypothetical protein